MEYEKTYLEIFKEHYPNVVLKGFYGSYCPAGFFKYGMDMHHPDCSAECDKCWSCTADSEWCESGDYEIPEEWKGISAPAQSEAAVPAAFDYSELDADTAAKLENVTAEIFNVRKEYIFAMAKKVAYAHDLLANHYGGKFGTWCESIGISRDTGNNLVRVAEIFGNISAEEQKNLSQLKPSLLYEAAKPSAPPELVEQVKSGDITTHKEYIALKKQLEEAKKSEEKAKAEYEEIFAENNENSRKLSEYLSKNTALERQIKELESRPVDVQIQQPDEAEISVQAREMAQGLIRSAEAAADKRVREFQQELEKKDRELNELSEKLREAQASVLDAAFESNSESGAEQIREFYEMLHSRALSALRDCFDFIGMDIPSESAKAIRSRLRTFGEVVELYINELEER